MRLLIILILVIILLLSYFRTPIKNKIVEIYNKTKAKIKK
jgi:hypothetical protein